MFKKTIFSSLIAVAVFSMVSFSATAQTVQLRVRIMMNNAPVKGAIIDVFRSDLPGEYKDFKTNNDGRFTHAGLPFTGTYVICVSAPGASPQARGPMRIQDTEYTFELSPGDGKRLTKDEAKQFAAAGAPKSTVQEESAESKKAREEFAKEKERVETANKKAADSNAIYDKALKEGNAAFNAKNFDDAIVKYDEAVKFDPTHPGAPVLLLYKSYALRNRGLNRYNNALEKMQDGTEKTEAINSARQDIKGAVEDSTRALELLKNSTEMKTTPQYKKNLDDTIAARAEALRLAVKTGDPSQAENAYAAYQEYIAVITDPVIKLQAKLTAADLLFTSGKLDESLAEYKKLSESNPESYEVYRGLGIILFSLGYEKNDKSMLQDAANYLQLFVDKAPDTLKEKGEAKSILETLKNDEKIKAQKITPTKKKGN